MSPIHEVGDHEVEVTTTIRAAPQVVFDYLVQSDKLSVWLDANATIEPEPGGQVMIDFYKYGTVVTGNVVAVDPPRRLVLTWGVNEGPEKDAMPAGSTTVTILIEPTSTGSKVTLQHSGLPTHQLAEDHEGGWEMYLGQLESAVDKSQAAASGIA